jgi:hypothetical protein
VVKSQTNQPGSDDGKSSGYRSILIFRLGERAMFMFAFTKSKKGNRNATELKVYRKAASIMLELGDGEIQTEVKAGQLVEVKDDEQGSGKDLQERGDGCRP